MHYKSAVYLCPVYNKNALSVALITRYFCEIKNFDDVIDMCIDAPEVLKESRLVHGD